MHHAGASPVDASDDYQADPRSDLELVAAINDGNADAFEALYRRHRDWVVHLAHRFTGDRDLALDVMQETFLYLLRKFPGFRLTAQLRTFLYPAVRNLSIAARRKTERYQSSEAELAVFAATPAGDTPKQDRGELATVLGSLPDEQREVLLLRFVDELSLNEVAEAMAIPLGTVKSRLHNALQRLRQDKLTKNLFEQ
jgi:RNA polymerase sigma-70 factor (ECF subfamily)